MLGAVLGKHNLCYFGRLKLLAKVYRKNNNDPVNKTLIATNQTVHPDGFNQNPLPWAWFIDHTAQRLLLNSTVFPNIIHTVTPSANVFHVESVMLELPQAASSLKGERNRQKS